MALRKRGDPQDPRRARDGHATAANSLMLVSASDHSGPLKSLFSFDSSGVSEWPRTLLTSALTDPHGRDSRMRFFAAQFRSRKDVPMDDPRSRQGKALKHSLVPLPGQEALPRSPRSPRIPEAPHPKVQLTQAPGVTGDAKIAVVAIEHLTQAFALQFKRPMPH